jgi:hypothetical protein
MTRIRRGTGVRTPNPFRASPGEPLSTPSSQVPENARSAGATPNTDAGAPAAAPELPPSSGYQGLFCRFCSSRPAAHATFRGHQGFLVMMKFLKLEGPFCRTCGIATHRSLTAKSLWQGWWGLASMVINPITMLLNLPQRRKINKLAPPLPGALGRPMNPGRPLFKRFAVLGFLVPALVIVAIVYNVQHDPSYASVGDCVHNKHTSVSGAGDTHPDVVVLACSDPSADAKIVGKVKNSSDGETSCKQFSEYDGYYSEEQGRDRFTLCLHFLDQNEHI